MAQGPVHDDGNSFIVNITLDVRAAVALPATVTALGTWPGALPVDIHTTLMPGDNTVSLRMIVTNVPLWYPLPYGPANVYNISATLTTLEASAQAWVGVGFRSIALVTTGNPLGPDGDGSGNSSFYFLINSVVCFFC